MWIYVKRGSTLRCPCGQVTDMGSIEMYISVTDFEAGRFQVTCDCGDPFSFEVLDQCGAQIVSEPRLLETGVRAVELLS